MSTEPTDAPTSSIETGPLKRFAQAARRQLLEIVTAKLGRVLSDNSAARRESPKAVEELEKQIADSSREQVIERVAYTWFNRLCALRFMDVNRYTRIGTVSPAEGFTQPEILADAKQGVFDDDLKVDRQKVLGLLDGTLPSNNGQGEAYQLLLVAVCNSYHVLMPFMFERIADYTELLMPDDLLSDNSVLGQMRDVLTTESCKDVEVIGWLYQFYISEKKDDVFAALKKGKKITPENIPAATQLFTPHWIVRYLVENSLGRLWMLNHPESKLVEQMDYYIKPEEPETDFLRISKPEEIKICDPACGSGHMLTYAFDLLYAIYEEQGYEATDIPRLILTHNLYGIEIDQRAGALAAFALTMKAREKDRRFFTRKSQPDASVRDSSSIGNPKSPLATAPNICVLENIKIDPQEFDDYMDRVGRDLFSVGLQGVVNQWEEADNFGSLIRPLVTDVSEVLELLRERQMGADLFLADVHQKVLKALKQADYLSSKYHVVVANPPYMGAKHTNPKLKKYLQTQFSDYKADAFSAFIARNIELGVVRAFLGYMTPFTWMFLSSYERLRKHLIKDNTITSLVQLEYSGFDGATVPICTFTVERRAQPKFRGAYIRLAAFRGADRQAPRTLEAIADPQCGWFFRVSATKFLTIPDAPIAFWVSDALLDSFAHDKTLRDYGDSRGGMQSGDTARFLRRWQEVSFNGISFGSHSRSEAKSSGRKWFPHQKGGVARKWYGNNEYLVNWENDGEEILAHCDFLNSQKASKMGVASTQFYFRNGITWNGISSGRFTVRFFPKGMIFDNASPSFFPFDESNYTIIGCFLNSVVGCLALECFNQTLNNLPGIIAKVPFKELPATTRTTVNELGIRAMELAKGDWDSFEVSWDFVQNPLLQSQIKCATIEQSWERWKTRCLSRIAEIKTCEESINQIFIDAYGLSADLDSSVENVHITLAMAERDLDSQNFISYAVGCMLGRYSLDKPGLILANQGQTLADYLLRVSRLTTLLDAERALSEPESVTFVADAQVNCFSCGSSVPISDACFVISGEYDENNQLHGRPFIYCAECCEGKQSKYVTWQQPLEKFTVAQALQRKWCEPETLKTFLDLAGCFGHRVPVAPTDVTFLPDEDNVIPILDGDWFPDDITERFKAFLKATFDTEHYEENLTFLENALYPENLTGRKRKTIRDYFLKDFYNHHIKLYKKRPIYWLFSSPKGTFNALIYMHRYRPDTVSVVLGYLRDFRDKLTHHTAHLQSIADRADGSNTEKTKALKEINELKKQIQELNDYERNTIFPLAQQQINIDLDDGVKVNYLKFGSALKKIPGLEKSEE